MINLKKIRKEKGLSQVELAAKAGVSTATLYYLENGKAENPNKSTLIAIAQALGVTVGEIKED